MNIVFVSSEAVPFAKTGGLADVSGTLPAAISRLGHQVVLFLPLYRQARQSGQPLQPTDVNFQIALGGKQVNGRLLQSSLPDSDVTVYLVEQDDYFDRAALYGEDQEYKDNCERFTFFSRAVMEAVPQLGLKVDILHCNDWQTGLIPAYLQTQYRAVQPGFASTAAVLTIHNMAYQGQFWHWDMLLTGLDWKYFNWRQLEFHGHLNLLKAGIVFADALNTVSPTYAHEIQSAPLGCGLESVLSYRSAALRGIVNGVDYSQWNPTTDRHLPQTYDTGSWQSGKAACKAALQRQLGLAERPDAMLLGLVGRLAWQKGWELVLEAMNQWAPRADVQWVVLGTGEDKYRQGLSRLARSYSGQIAASTDFDESLAHRIEAAADVFVMPSLYEPCGLNQLYSLKYGAVPVVRKTGGLADTIVDATPENLQAGVATGFHFQDATAEQLLLALQRAETMFRSQPQQWQQLVQTGMDADWSWTRSACHYVDMYEQTLASMSSGAAVR